MVRRSDTNPSLEQVMELVVRQLLKDTRIGLPGQVVGYDVTTKRAAIEVGIGERDPDTGAPVPLPVIPAVRVAMFKGGGYQMRASLEVGDQGWLVFGERDISAWLQAGGVQLTPTARRSDWSDAVFWPGVVSDANVPVTPAGEEGLLVLESTTSNARLSLDKDGGVVSVYGGGNVILGDPGDVLQDVATAQKVLAELQALKTYLDTHTHLGVTAGAAITGPPGVLPAVPTPAPTPTLPAATRVKART